MRGAPPELLDSVPLFGGLRPRERQEIARMMTGRLLDSGDSIVVEGQEGVGFFVIETGSARVSVGGEDVRRLGPRDFFGEIALISGSPRSATVTAETPLRCWALTTWDFRPIVQNDATVAWTLLETLAKMLAKGP